MNTTEIAIVGAGPAGLVAALAAARLGLSAVVYDGGGAPPSGGLILQHNGRRVLEALGLWDELAPRAQPVSGLALALHGGLEVATVDFTTLPPPLLQPVGLAAAELNAALRRAVLAAGVPIHVGCGVVGWWQEEDRGVLKLRDGAEAAHGIVLACDGSRSVIREGLGLGGRGEAPTEAWLRGISTGALPSTGILEAWGPNHTRFVTYPIDLKRQAFFCTVPAGDWPSLRQTRMADWRASWAGFGDEVGKVLDGVEDWAAVQYAEVWEVDVKRWYHPPVFLVGDAAHATTPLLGQGANAAMVDALVLVQLLARVGLRGASLADIGQTWENLRRPFTSQLQAVSRQIAAVANLTSPAACYLRDTLLPLASRTAWLHERVLRLSLGHHAPDEGYLAPLR